MRTGKIEIERRRQKSSFNDTEEVDWKKEI